MKIGIILHPYGEEKPAGLARTIFELTKGLLENDSYNPYTVFLKERPRVLPPLPGNNWQAEVLGGGRFWLDRLRHASGQDVYIFNTPVMPFFYRPKKAVIIALDFAYWYFPLPGLRGEILRRVTSWYHGFSLRRADAIIAISEATKRDMVFLFGIPKEKIRVIHCGYKRVCDVPENAIRNLPEKFFLYTGIVKERKNVFNVVRAFGEFKQRFPEYHLVIGGNAEGPYAESIRRYVPDNRLAENVRFMGHLNDGELSFLYKRAQALVFPSFIEGFGYPVLEAMHCGLPVITSSVSSLAELATPQSALLVNPHSVEELTEAMIKIASDQSVRSALIKNGKLRAEHFSWDKAAREVFAFLTEIPNHYS